MFTEVFVHIKHIILAIYVVNWNHHCKISAIVKVIESQDAFNLGWTNIILQWNWDYGEHTLVSSEIEVITTHDSDITRNIQQRL